MNDYNNLNDILNALFNYKEGAGFLAGPASIYLHPIECPLCRTKNPPLAEYCRYCGLGNNLGGLARLPHVYKTYIDNYAKKLMEKK